MTGGQIPLHKTKMEREWARKGAVLNARAHAHSAGAGGASVGACLQLGNWETLNIGVLYETLLFIMIGCGFTSRQRTYRFCVKNFAFNSALAFN